MQKRVVSESDFQLSVVDLLVGCQDIFFVRMARLLAKMHAAHRFVCSFLFLRVGFTRLPGIGQVRIILFVPDPAVWRNLYSSNLPAD